MRSTLVRAAPLFSGFSKSSGDLVLTPCNSTCRLPAPQSNAASCPVVARGLHLGTAPAAWRSGSGYIGSRGQFRHPADRQHGCADHLAGCSASRALALLCVDGNCWRCDRRLHHLRFGSKRRQGSDGTQAFEKTSRKGLQEIRKMGIRRHCNSSHSASTVSFCAVPAGSRRYAVLAKKVPGGARSRSRGSLFDRRLPRVSLRKPYPPLLLPVLQANSGHTDRLGRHRRNPFVDPVPSLQERDWHPAASPGRPKYAIWSKDGASVRILLTPCP